MRLLVKLSLAGSAVVFLGCSGEVTPSAIVDSPLYEPLPHPSPSSLTDSGKPPPPSDDGSFSDVTTDVTPLHDAGCGCLTCCLDR